MLGYIIQPLRKFTETLAWLDVLKSGMIVIWGHGQGAMATQTEGREPSKHVNNSATATRRLFRQSRSRLGISYWYRGLHRPCPIPIHPNAALR